MLSSVLNNERAVQVNIYIIRTFVQLRDMLSTHKDLRRKIEAMEKKYNHQFKVVFDTIKQLIEPPPKPRETHRLSCGEGIIWAYIENGCCPY